MLRNLLAVAHALSDPTRLRIIKLLAVRDLCVCQLEYLLGATQSRVSQNLTVLKYADLVTDTRRGRMVFYSLNRPAFESAIADLSSIITDQSLDNTPEMGDEMKRWQELPPDLSALFTANDPHMELNGPPETALAPAADIAGKQLA